MKSNIVLIGISGSGKTTIGKMLAERLQMEFYDTDREIEKLTGKMISQYFAEYGEARFRLEETAMVKKLSQYDHCVISTGGGVVLNRQNIDYLQEKGTLICFSTRPEIILERIKADINRPLFHNGDPYQNILRLLRERKKLYQVAELTIDTSDMDFPDVVSEIHEFVKHKE
ncbi:shikimate kinase [Candidatus Formimonas warabiya]|uniref:Shikimate kinase n=1 Tax=Formimonas warabiya TaxID=1761012 RepID=A0A3G1KNM3_FORW1|nr:shikimate kinase [Candidatus Formimonas warabiya]ATW24020.1 hypothetical protein DCMF_03730 [Candidatus Formimonas warabiya]